MYLLYIFPAEFHTFMTLLLLTFLTHSRKILLVVLQIGKAKDLSAPLRITVLGTLLRSLACSHIPVINMVLFSFIMISGVQDTLWVSVGCSHLHPSYHHCSVKFHDDQ
jgi:hypothetical protein